MAWNRPTVLYPPYELNNMRNSTYVDTWAITNVGAFPVLYPTSRFDLRFTLNSRDSRVIETKQFTSVWES